MSVASPVPFVFDTSLVEDVSGSLLPNCLVVDNLTIDELRNKQTELEMALRVNQERQATLLSASPTADSNGTFPIESFRIATLDGGLRHNKSYSYDNRELNELKSEAKRLNRQAEVIKAALSSLGCEDVPPGCDLSLDASFIDGQDVLQGEEQPSPFGQKRNVGPQQRLANILRKPFRRKSVTTSPGSTRRFGDDRFGDDRFADDGDLVATVANGNGGNGLDSSAAASRDREQADLLVRTLADIENEDHDGLCAEHVRNLIQRTPCFLLNNAMDFDNPAPANTCLELTSLECDMDTAGNEAQSLSEEEWFHGVLPREEVVRLLTREGDFLVRETTRNDECQTVLSVCWGGHKHFIVQTTTEGQYRFEGPSFPTIGALINHQYESGLPVTSRSGAVLRHPIPRERWELNNDDIILGDKIGRGNFGDVYKATLKSGRQEVAVKTCRVTQEDHKKKFLQEGRILKQYDHPNVVKLIGIAVQKQPIMIVMELVPGGSLLTFLRNHGRTLTEKQLCGMCRDVAAGMQYLESKNCIHRDLAARNCLVGYENIVKISDFGMSREEEEYIVSDGMKQIPIKWTAPEALNFGKYTSLCDVWSYGILAWEVFSRGDIPYNGLSNSKAREKIDTGYRMPAPDGTPEEMYQLMLRCWEYDPERRPHFIQIYKAVDTLYSSFR